MKKWKVFEKEINLIENDELKEKTKFWFDEIVPDYFFEVPASSTGKYHPRLSLGKGGLVRHTKACINVANDLRRAEIHDFTDYTYDLAYVALLIHDTFKNGNTDTSKTVTEHPDIAAKHARMLFGDNVAFAVLTHMGKWHKPKPECGLSKFVHMCDYLASRKWCRFEDLEKVEK